MKNIASLVNLVIVALFVLLISTDTTAQNSSDRQVVKEWLIANKDKVTLVSTLEYQSMSPSVKAMVNSAKNTIVYNEIVTLSDIQSVVNRNPEGAFENAVSFLKKEKKEKLTGNELAIVNEKAKKDLENSSITKVQKWIKTNQVRVYSQDEFNSFSQSVKDKINALPQSGKLIYQGTELTWEDIQVFEQAKAE